MGIRRRVVAARVDPDRWTHRRRHIERTHSHLGYSLTGAWTLAAMQRCRQAESKRHARCNAAQNRRSTFPSPPRLLSLYEPNLDCPILSRDKLGFTRGQGCHAALVVEVSSLFVSCACGFACARTRAHLCVCMCVCVVCVWCVCVWCVCVRA